MTSVSLQGVVSPVGTEDWSGELHGDFGPNEQEILTGALRLVTYFFEGISQNCELVFCVREKYLKKTAVS